MYSLQVVKHGFTILIWEGKPKVNIKLTLKSFLNVRHILHIEFLVHGLTVHSRIIIDVNEVITWFYLQIK